MVRHVFELPVNAITRPSKVANLNLITVIKSLFRLKGNGGVKSTPSTAVVNSLKDGDDRESVGIVSILCLLLVAIVVLIFVFLLPLPTKVGTKPFNATSATMQTIVPSPVLNTMYLERERNLNHLVHHVSPPTPHVTTSSGQLSGDSMLVRGTTIHRYRGIPYARAPVDELRFRRPLPVESWPGVLEATDWSSPCVQFVPQGTLTPWISGRSNGSEDCLYLNIWAPKRSELKSRQDELRTVMVWFHGGAFFSGSADVDLYAGEYIAALGDVVVVSLNYRLGALGFLNANLDQYGGNMGMFDQLMALNWIKDNVAAFGGDSNKVVLFGQSAGATSAGLHLFSPLSRNLTNRVILQSGSPLFPKNYFDNSLDKSNEYSYLVNCSTDSGNDLHSNPSDVIACLQELPLDELVAGHEPMFQKYKIPFFPRYGDDFLPELPHDTIGELADELDRRPDVLIGSTEDEGSFFLHLFFPHFFSNSRVNATLNVPLAKQFISKAYSYIPERQAKMMSEFFLSGLSGNASLDTITKTTYDVIGNSGFTCPAVLMSESLASQNMTVYHYLFTHRPSTSIWGKWLGSTHMDEVEFVFGRPLDEGDEYTDEEIQFSERLIDTWTQFAKNGTVPDQLGQKWPKYSVDEQLYIELNPTKVSLNAGPRSRTCDLWKIIYDSFL